MSCSAGWESSSSTEVRSSGDLRYRHPFWLSVLGVLEVSPRGLLKDETWRRRPLAHGSSTFVMTLGHAAKPPRHDPREQGGFRSVPSARNRCRVSAPRCRKNALTAPCHLQY